MDDDYAELQDETQQQIQDETQQQPSDHETIIRLLKKKNKILRYQTLFPHYLSHVQYKFQDLDIMTEDQLDYLLKELDIIISSSNNSMLTHTVFYGAIDTTEKLAPIFSFNLSGLSQTLKEDQEVNDILNELSLKYDDITATPPEYRIILKILKTGFVLNAQNKHNVRYKEYLEKSISRDVQEKYKNL